jgi:glutathione synthase/RimK-type ligase-like ATP-grasp enzyme
MIAIHKSTGFSERWISYCKSNNIPYKVVNAYDNDIVEQLKLCDAFMWHFSHFNYKDMLIARQILYSLQLNGIKVFPDFNTSWHFDDKVGQKYLLEAVGAPLVNSYVFYNQKDAYEWLNITTYPIVFKLRGGAGASNVKLVKSKAEAKKLVKKSFNSGFKYYDPKVYFLDIFQKFKSGKSTPFELLKSFARLFKLPEFTKMYSREKGYVYFQDFIPNNNFDIRIIVIGEKAFAFKRLVRQNDFRASGSGCFIYDKLQIDLRCVEIGFDLNEKLKTQSIAYDFIYDKENNPKIVEISYGFNEKVYDQCEGYWTKDMQWHPGENFDFCGWMVENLIRE